MKQDLIHADPYKLIAEIGKFLSDGKEKAAGAVSNILVQHYWLDGNQIVEFEQKSNFTPPMKPSYRR